MDKKKQKETDFRWGLIIVSALLILVGVSGYLLLSRGQKTEPVTEVKSAEESVESQVDIAQLVKKLNKAGAVLYFSEGCGACQNQKEILGQYFDKLNTVSCVKNPEKCKEIQYVPTWIVGEKKETGAKTLEELEELVK